MKSQARLIAGCCRFAVLVLLAWSWPVWAAALVGARAPDFVLQDSDGKPHALASLQDRPMVMLYFFDADTQPSHGGLVSLDQLCSQYRQADLVVWAITRSSPDKVKRFAAQTPIGFPILIDTGMVSASFQADRIVPTTCILGPDLNVLDLVQGGGRSAEIMLERLAQRALQQRKSDFARAVSEKVVQDNPENVKARLVGAYADLAQGRLQESENAFARLAARGGQGQAAGLEGLSALAAQKGQVQKALLLAQQAEQSDPSRGYVHVIKADVLYGQNNKQAAESEYQKAVAKKNTEPYHQAKALNQLARMQADQGRWQQAQSLYDQAVALDPYYIEATTNKGLLHEKQGRWDQALACYTQAQRIDKADRYALMLQTKLLAMLQLERDRAEKSRIDALVKDLAARYRDQRQAKSQDVQDAWTSRPMVLSLVDLSETGGLAERDGFASIFTVQLADSLNVSGRVQVVERAVVEKLLQELNLGSSQLADASTALELGKVLSAKLIITGSLYYHQGQYLLTLRLIDTETTRIAKVISAQIAGAGPVQKDVHRLNRQILTAIIEQYPLRGYVMQAGQGQVLVNLGSGQGVALGTLFDIVEPAAAQAYRGRQIQGQPKVIGQVQIVQVDSDSCQGRIVHTLRPITRDDMLREKLTDLSAGNVQG